MIGVGSGGAGGNVSREIGWEVALVVGEEVGGSRIGSTEDIANPYSSLSSHVAPPIAFAVTLTLVALSAALQMLSSKTWSMFVTCPGSSGFVSIAASN